MVSFLLFVRPAIRKLIGYDSRYWHLPEFCALTENALNTAGDRRQYLRGKVTYTDGQFRVSTAANQGYGMLSSMTGTNCLVILEPGKTLISRGTEVRVLLMSNLV